MTTVKIHHGPKPTEAPKPTSPEAAPRSASPALKPGQIVDSTGRVLAFKKLTPLDQMRLARLVGPKDSENQMLMGFAAAAAALQSINGEPCHVATMTEIEVMVDRLGEPGIQAAGEFFKTLGAQTESEVVASAKNL